MRTLIEDTWPPSFFYIEKYRLHLLFKTCRPESISAWLIKQVVQETATVVSFMTGEDGARLAQLVHELQPRIRAFQITQLMCSAWMKPVCTCTMGHGHKTVNASPRLGWPVSVEVILSQRAHFFHRSPVSFISTSHCRIVGSEMKFSISLFCNDNNRDCMM